MVGNGGPNCKLISLELTQRVDLLRSHFSFAARAWPSQRPRALVVGRMLVDHRHYRTLVLRVSF